ncbi:MAG TPA: prolyl oligopeptidase family serine peptidase [Gemmatimonadales bacterium]|nr:prolyl oligopeptidase family serine peptidase [Gemmatimonadales bacterium]
MLSLLLLLQATPVAQQPAPLTVPYIMRGPENTGREPSQVRWSPDGQYIYFRWLPPGTDWREQLKPYRVRANGGAPEQLTPAQADSMAPLLAEGSDSRDRRWRAVSALGDIWLVDRRAGKATRLTQTRESESDPVLSTDTKTIYFTRDGNLYGVTVATGAVIQLTDIRKGPKPKDEEAPTGQRGFLQNENRALLGAVSDRFRSDSINKIERARRDTAWGTTIWLDAEESVDRIVASPSGMAAVVLTTKPGKARTANVPDFIAQSGYTTDIPTRDNVGDQQDASRVGMVSLPRGAVTWLKPIPGDSAKAPAWMDVRGWSQHGFEALLWSVSRDFKARYLSVLRPTVGTRTASLEIIDSLRDSTWVGGPCEGCAGWLPTGEAWFVSEADGYAHLYTYEVVGIDGPPSTRRQLTSGRWEVLDVDVSPDGNEFWLHTSETSPYERHFWRMPVTGGARTRITTAIGGHTVTVSPDGRSIADVASSANRPPELFVGQFRAGAAMTKLTTSPTAEWLGRTWLTPDIIEIPASDGAKLPARIYRPEQVGARPNGAAVIFVHGAGYLHNVHRYWSSYFREYQFHHLLAQRGYVVLDVDYRASAGYGRDWRTAIYRHMGGRDLQDQVDASRWLRTNLSIPAERVGIYGGSYGGFITLMALFTAPKEFGAGAALRSVTDWAHYNHGYTAEILNQPQDDSLAYRQSSPIYFAQGLEDPLLIAHGMIDTNVHFQDDVRLVQRLIELGKTGWEMAIYPAEDHGFVRPDSWTDEYGRILSLFDRTIGSTH